MNRMIKMTIKSVEMELIGDRPNIVLEEYKGDRNLVIPFGFEYMGLISDGILEETHNSDGLISTWLNLISALDAKLYRIEISGNKKGDFFAFTVLRKSNQEQVKVRHPVGLAIGLAAHSTVPVFADESLIDSNKERNIEFDGYSEDTEEVIGDIWERFKKTPFYKYKM